MFQLLTNKLQRIVREIEFFLNLNRFVVVVVFASKQRPSCVQVKHVSMLFEPTIDGGTRDVYIYSGNRTTQTWI